ncbi:c-type cytochrome [Phenylobacterium immobile]|uniref:c-type cytochrome n=1 Tax=Phenylobacterium immobile TaxID=21 RepID=UPI000AFC1625|nr:cytochrome c [Phenylobacterium immobile]
MTLKTRTALIAAALAVALPSAGWAAPSGLQLFGDNCAACHMRTGVGIPGAFPALKASKFVNGDPKAVSQTVLNGRGGMPAFKTSLNDADMATVLTFIRSSWGNKGAAITPAQIAAARKAPYKPAASALQAH